MRFLPVPFLFQIVDQLRMYFFMPHDSHDSAKTSAAGSAIRLKLDEINFYDSVLTRDGC